VSYTVGDAFNTFPAAQWKAGVNGPTLVTFNLTPDQLADRTIRIGISAAYAGGRPQIKVNGWTSPVPASSSQPDSRSLTTGNYRGNNATFSYKVPASAFVAGANTMRIDIASGSCCTVYLSPAVAFDAIDML
jgi:rhamnogalacturonan endolyase